MKYYFERKVLDEFISDQFAVAKDVLRIVDVQKISHFMLDQIENGRF